MTDFRKTFTYQISRKSVCWEPSCSMWTDMTWLVVAVNSTSNCCTKLYVLKTCVSSFSDNSQKYVRAEAEEEDYSQENGFSLPVAGLRPLVMVRTLSIFDRCVKLTGRNDENNNNNNTYWNRNYISQMFCTC